MVGLGKPKLCTTFEVPSFGHCVNIKVELQNFGELPSPGPRPLFLLRVILWWALANPSCVPYLKLVATAITEILLGNPKIFGSSPSPRPTHFFSLGVILWWALSYPSGVPNLKSLVSAVAKICFCHMLFANINWMLFGKKFICIWYITVKYLVCSESLGTIEWLVYHARCYTSALLYLLPFSCCCWYQLTNW